VRPGKRGPTRWRRSTRWNRARRLNYREGYTLTPLGTVTARDGGLPTVAYDATSWVSGPGHYLVRSERVDGPSGAAWSRVELRADDLPVAVADAPTLTGSPKRRLEHITDFLLQVEPSVSGTRYEVRLIDGRGEGVFAISGARVQPEGFGPVDW
jgi:hypothetical protein